MAIPHPPNEDYLLRERQGDSYQFYVVPNMSEWAQTCARTISLVLRNFNLKLKKSNFISLGLEYMFKLCTKNIVSTNLLKSMKEITSHSPIALFGLFMEIATNSRDVKYRHVHAMIAGKQSPGLNATQFSGETECK